MLPDQDRRALGVRQLIRSRRHRFAGFTLVELIIAMAITTVMLGAMTSSVLIATRALPRDDEPADRGAAALLALAETGDSQPLLACVETGQLLADGSPAPGPRVKLPWGMFDYDITTLTPDGQTIMQRSIDWAAAGGGGGGGGGACMMAVNDIAMSFRNQGKSYYGRATIRITDGNGADVEGATVSVTWSGDITGTSQGVTDAFGTIMLESAGKRNGGTFTCTVTDVVLTDCTYEPTANVETTDTIIAP